VLVSEEYILVIDCDKYAGSFADPLCAYCTGFTGEESSQHSVEMSELYYADLGIEDDESPKGRLADDKNPLADLVIDQQDENGNWQPCAVWPSRIYGMNASGKAAKLTEKNYDDYNFPAGFSVGIFMYENPDEKTLTGLKDRAKKFFSEIWPSVKGGEKVNIEGYRMIVHRKTAEEVTV
jgi:hypothetical protein